MPRVSALKYSYRLAMLPKYQCSSVLRSCKCITVRSFFSLFSAIISVLFLQN